MQENLEYRMGIIEKQVSEYDQRNIAAHKEFYSHQSKNDMFQATVNERCDSRCKDLEELKKDNVVFKTFIALTETNYTNLNATLQVVAADVKSLRENRVVGGKWS